MTAAARALATGFGLGHLPVAPGTWAALAAIPPGMMIAAGAGPSGLLLAALIAFGLGLWACPRATAGRDDPPEIVIDEIAGQWLALVPAGSDPVLATTAFVVFRVCDIGKVWPAGPAERLRPAGLGIMADDAIAGAYAALLVWSLGAIGLDWRP